MKEKAEAVVGISARLIRGKEARRKGTQRVLTRPSRTGKWVKAGGAEWLAR